MSRPLLLAALLAGLAPLARASSAKDLTGSWLGRLGCEDGAYRLSLRGTEEKSSSALSYGLSGIDGSAGRVAGTGVLESDGRLTLSRPVPNPLLPETMPAVLIFDPASPKFTGRTDLGAFESAAGATADCVLREKGAVLDCAVDWHLMQQGSRCRMRLRKAASQDDGPLPCPEGMSGTRAEGFLHCAPAKLKKKKV